MSFHWNLSSEDESIEEEKKQEELVISVPPFAKAAGSKASTEIHESSEEDDEDIEWEDADVDDGEEEEDSKLPASLKPVTINLGSTLNSTTKMPTKEGQSDKSKVQKKGKKKRRNVFRNSKLPPQLQKLLVTLHQSHLLALTTRAVLVSQSCSDLELLALSHSLLPTRIMNNITINNNNISNVRMAEPPTLQDVRHFFETWYFTKVNQLTQRRQSTWRRNQANGAPRGQRKRTHHSMNTDERDADTSEKDDGTKTTNLDSLKTLCSQLSNTNEENPQLSSSTPLTMSSHDKVTLLISILRSMGWRARYVVAMDPMKQDLDVSHPLLVMTKDVLESLSEATPTCTPSQLAATTTTNTHTTMEWVEVLCQQNNKPKWIHVDVEREWIQQPRSVESVCFGGTKSATNRKKRTISYALAVEHLSSSSSVNNDDERLLLRLTDVTPRYANSWTRSKTLRGESNEWFSSMIHNLNNQSNISDRRKRPLSSIGASPEKAINLLESDDDDKKPAAVAVGIIGVDPSVDAAEQAELSEAATQETMPTSKAAFQNHASFVLKSLLNQNQILSPNATMCGMFKGQPVYRRSDVSLTRTKTKWPYHGRQVKEGEVPVKRIKARRIATSDNGNKFQKLDSYGVGVSNDGSEEFRQRQVELGSMPDDDGMESLYAEWQTVPWSPPAVGPNDEIPVNSHRNVELALLNPGLVHLDRPGMAKVAKKLGVPYAPCLLGFEGHYGNRTPTIRGIVVHEHNAAWLEEAHVEFDQYSQQQEAEKRRRKIRKRWKKLIKGMLLKERLEREYGSGGDA